MSRPRNRNDLWLVHGPVGLIGELIVGGTEYVFDADRVDRVQEHYWYAGRDGRLCTHVGVRRGTIYLSRHLTNAVPGQRVMHLNGDVTDLRLQNLSVRPLDTPAALP
jgi:hypothetical protein